MKEIKKSPSEKGEYSAEEIAEYECRISVIRGLINYHERMVSPVYHSSEIYCEKDQCPVIMFENDMYLAALKECLRLMERELNEMRR